MGRIARDGLDYFAIDVNFDDNLMLFVAKHKMEGLGVLLQLWQKCYGQRGYYVEWSDDNVVLFAYSINIPVETLISMVETCFKVGIFHRGIWERHRILTSSGIQKRWLLYVKNAKRQNTCINVNYDVSLFIPDEMLVDSVKTPGKSAKTPAGMPRKERKRKEEKGREVSTRACARNGKSIPVDPPAGELAIPPTPPPPPAEPSPPTIWEICVETWFVFYEGQFKEKPSFAGRDPSALKSLLKLIEKKVLAAGHLWTWETCGKQFLRFLQIAWTDDWLKKNFLLQNLLSQFDKIIANGRTATNVQPAAHDGAGTGNGNPAVPAKLGTSAARVNALASWGSHLRTGDSHAQTG